MILPAYAGTLKPSYGAGGGSSSGIMLNMRFNNDNLADTTGRHTCSMQGRYTTAIVYEGSHSLEYLVTGGFTVTDSSNDFDFGAGNFNITFAVFVGQPFGDYGHIAGGNYSFGIHCVGGGVNYPAIWLNGSALLVSSSYLPLNSWAVLTYKRVGTALSIELDGNVIASMTSSANFSNPNSGFVSSSVGYLDSLTITKG